MATFTQGFIPSTSDDGNDLIITDSSVYTAILPKSVFSSRSITVVKTNGVSITYNFPFTGTSNNIQDELIIANFFDKDYYLIITLNWIFNNEGTADTSTKTLDYLSNYFSLTQFVEIVDQIESCDKDNEYQEDYLTRATSFNNYMEDAILWAKFGNAEKSQKFLDKCKDIYDVFNNSN